MAKKLSLGAALLASITVLGPVCARDLDKVPGQARPPILMETHRFDYPQVFPAPENRLMTEPAGLVAIAIWLSQHFDLPAANELPRVELLPPARLVAIRYPGLLTSKTPTLQQAMLDAQRTTLAVYDDVTRTIYLPEGWRGETPTELSVLVHEMVHHLQRQAQKKFECPQEREAIAYAAQDRWLSYSGLSLEGEFGIDPLTRLVRTRCLG